MNRRYPIFPKEPTIDWVASWLKIEREYIAAQWPHMTNRFGVLTNTSWKIFWKMRAHEPDHQAGSSRVYFLHAPAVGMVKIGRSRNIEQRMIDLRCASPVPLKLIMTVDGGLTTERMMHERFKPYRKHGEWFKASRTLMRWIDSFRLGAECYHEETCDD